MTQAAVSKRLQAMGNIQKEGNEKIQKKESAA